MPCYRTPFKGIIHWPFMDFGSLGTLKQLVGFDLVADAPEGVSVSVGYDQTDRDTRTEPYLVDSDTLPGQLVPLPVTAPSLDLRLEFEPSQAWEWQAANLYVQNLRGGT